MDTNLFSDMSITIEKKDPNKLSIDSQLQTYVYNEDIDKFLKMDLKSLQEHAKKENADVKK